MDNTSDINKNIKFLKSKNLNELQEEFLKLRIKPSVSIKLHNKMLDNQIINVDNTTNVKNKKNKKAKDIILLDIKSAELSNSSILSSNLHKSNDSIFKKLDKNNVSNSIDLTTGLPKAINIKNYDYIKENEYLKNTLIEEKNKTNNKDIKNYYNSVFNNNDIENINDIRMENLSKIKNMSKQEKSKLLNEIYANVPVSFIKKIKTNIDIDKNNKSNLTKDITSNDNEQSKLNIYADNDNINLLNFSFKKLENINFDLEGLYKLLCSSSSNHIRIGLEYIIKIFKEHSLIGNNCLFYISSDNSFKKVINIVNSLFFLLESTNNNISFLSISSLLYILNYYLEHGNNLIFKSVFEYLNLPLISNKKIYLKNNSNNYNEDISYKVLSLVCAYIKNYSISENNKDILNIVEFEKTLKFNSSKLYNNLLNLLGILNNTKDNFKASDNFIIKILNLLKISIYFINIDEEFRFKIIDNKYYFLNEFFKLIIYTKNDNSVLNQIYDFFSLLSIYSREFYFDYYNLINKYNELKKFTNKKLLIINSLYNTSKNSANLMDLNIYDNDNYLNNILILNFYEEYITNNTKLKILLDNNIFSLDTNKYTKILNYNVKDTMYISNKLELKIKFYKILKAIHQKNSSIFDVFLQDNKEFNLLSEEENNLILRVIENVLKNLFKCLNYNNNEINNYSYNFLFDEISSTNKLLSNYYNLLKICEYSSKLVRYKKIKVNSIVKNYVNEYISFLISLIIEDSNFNIQYNLNLVINDLSYLILHYTKYHMINNMFFKNFKYILVSFPSILYFYSEYFYYRYISILKKHLFSYKIKSYNYYMCDTNNSNNSNENFYDLLNNLNLFIYSEDVLNTSQLYCQVKFNNIRLNSNIGMNLITNNLVDCESVTNLQQKDIMKLKLPFFSSINDNFIQFIASRDFVSFDIFSIYIDIILIINYIDTNLDVEKDSNFISNNLIKYNLNKDIFTFNNFLSLVTKLNNINFDKNYIQENHLICLMYSIVKCYNFKQNLNNDKTYFEGKITAIRNLKSSFEEYCTTFFNESLTGSASTGIRCKIHYRIIIILLMAPDILDKSICKSINNLVYEDYLNFIFSCNKLTDLNYYGIKNIILDSKISTLNETISLLICLKQKYLYDPLLAKPSSLISITDYFIDKFNLNKIIEDTTYSENIKTDINKTSKLFKLSKAIYHIVQNYTIS